MEIEQDMTISSLRGLQFKSSSEEGCQKQSSFPSSRYPAAVKAKTASSSKHQARKKEQEKQPQLATAQGSGGRATCPASPATNFSYFGSWSLSPTKHIPSYSLPVPTSLRAHERTGKLLHHTGEKFLRRK